MVLLEVFGNGTSPFPQGSFQCSDSHSIASHFPRESVQIGACPLESSQWTPGFIIVNSIFWSEQTPALTPRSFSSGSSNTQAVCVSASDSNLPLPSGRGLALLTSDHDIAVTQLMLGIGLQWSYKLPICQRQIPSWRPSLSCEPHQPSALQYSTSKEIR